jgi:hypothetical protein
VVVGRKLVGMVSARDLLVLDTTRVREPR